MRCEKIRTRLAEYAVGGLSRWRRARVEAHLEHCAGCRRELAVLARTGELLTQAAALESAPASTWAAIRHQIERADRPRVHPARPRLRLALAGALALVLLAVGGLVWRQPFAPAPVIVQVAKPDREIRTAEESHLSAVYSGPLSDPAAVGMRLDSLEEGS